jgi:hypothetical protein
MRIVSGVLYGLAATAVNFGLLYMGVRWLLGRAPDRAKALVPLLNLVRYLLFAAMLVVFLKAQLGSIWGLLIGVTGGIAAFTIWQGVTNARNRRSGQV